MTKKYLKTLLSVQVQCTGQLLKVQEADELICTLYSCIHAWAKKKDHGNVGGGGKSCTGGNRKK